MLKASTVVPSPTRVDVAHVRVSSVAARASSDVGSYTHPQLFELVLSQQLPTVDLSYTLLSRWFSAPTQERATAFMRTQYRALVQLHRVSSMLFFAVLLTNDPMLRNVLACVCSVGVLPVVALALYLSLDVVALLLRSYEFWFITALNTLHWTCLAVILHDMRVIACFPMWIGLQSFTVFDANTRTYAAAMRSVLIAIPSMIAIGVCCALKEVRDGHYAPVRLSELRVFPADVVVFTTSTLAIFMMKKVYAKWSRQHPNFGDSHSISCLMVRARLRCCVVAHGLRRAATGVLVDAQQLQWQTQQLRLSSRSLINLSSHRLLAPAKLLLAHPWMTWQLRILNVAGVVGFVSTGVAWMLSLSADPDTDRLRVASIAGAVGTCIFVGTFMLHLHHDLMYAMLFNFDYVFSAVQVYALAACLGDMLEWDAHRSLTVWSWSQWFQWVLFQDGLLPFVKERLRFRKCVAAPVMALILLSLVPVLYRILDGSVLKDSVIVHVKLSDTHGYRISVKTLALQRIVTIFCWSGRLVYGLAKTRDDELLFVRGPIEYLSPYEHFRG